MAWTWRTAVARARRTYSSGSLARSAIASASGIPSGT